MSDLESRELPPLIPISKCTVLVHPLRAAFYYTPYIGKQHIGNFYERVAGALPQSEDELFCIMPPDHTSDGSADKQIQGLQLSQLIVVPDLSRGFSNSSQQLIDYVREKGYQIVPAAEIVLGGVFLELCVANTASNILRTTDFSSVRVNKNLTFSARNCYADDSAFDTERYVYESRMFGLHVDDEGEVFKLTRMSY